MAPQTRVRPRATGERRERLPARSTACTVRICTFEPQWNADRDRLGRALGVSDGALLADDEDVVALDAERVAARAEGERDRAARRLGDVRGERAASGR